MHPKSLIHIIHLDDYHSDLLFVSVVFHFGYMPVAREENKEFIGITVIESCFLYLVIIVYHVWSVFAVGYTGVMVDDAKTLRSLYHILEIDVVVVTLAPSFCQWTVLRILYTYHQLCAGYFVLALADGEQVGMTQILEEGFPLCRVLLILQIEVYEVHAAVGLGLHETIALFARLSPLLRLLDELGLIAIILGIVTLDLCLWLAQILCLRLCLCISGRAE